MVFDYSEGSPKPVLIHHEFVRHTLSMDTTFPGNALKGKAITAPTPWTIAYWLIILAKAITGLILAFTALRLYLAVRGPAAPFKATEQYPVLGVGLGFLLWFTGFAVIGAAGRRARIVRRTISKRMLLASVGALVCTPGAKPARAALPPISLDRHERAMRAAIEQGRRNAAYPFGAAIVQA